MGYSKPKFSPVDHTSIAIENLPDMTKRTNISVFISLEPYIEIPDLISTGLECIEIDNIEVITKNSSFRSTEIMNNLQFPSDSYQIVVRANEN